MSWVLELLETPGAAGSCFFLVRPDMQAEEQVRPSMHIHLSSMHPFVSLHSFIYSFKTQRGRREVMTGLLVRATRCGQSLVPCILPCREIVSTFPWTCRPRLVAQSPPLRVVQVRVNPLMEKLFLGVNELMGAAQELSSIMPAVLGRCVKHHSTID